MDAVFLGSVRIKILIEMQIYVPASLTDLESVRVPQMPFSVTIYTNQRFAHESPSSHLTKSLVASSCLFA